jgi:hypothetical protein
MASQTLQSIRTYVRAYMDLDESDLSNDLIDAWCSEGSLLIERAEKRWPFYESTWTLTSVADQEDYTISSAIGSDIREIVAITGPKWELAWVDRMEADRRWPRNDDSSGDVVAWSQWTTTTLRLHPTPGSAETLTVRGYRTPTDWVADGAGGTPDFPDELHPTLMAFVMARAYLQQEDEVLAERNMSIFEASLKQFRDALMSNPGFQPLVLNGRHTYGRGAYLPARLRYPFE